MYKLIIGNVRITVTEDDIGRDQAAGAAREAISAANRQGKSLSHVEVSKGESGLEVQTTEKAGNRAARKTIKQSMLDSMLAAAKEKLYPASMFSNKDAWFDSDTGQEWHGEAINEAKEELLQAFAEWIKTVK
ncbi:MAG: hypothetical protein LLG02_09655 [Pelosinus sp.]|nr:hypothetical protein [Pelosinus sp.]